MKVVILGDDHIGKSTWVYSLLGFSNRPKPTLGVEVFDYNHNGRKITIWDTSNTGLYGGYILGADYAIIFHKNGSIEKYKQDLGNNIPYVSLNISELSYLEEPLAGL
jgi:GTPase SAR1 family protein